MSQPANTPSYPQTSLDSLATYQFAWPWRSASVSALDGSITSVASPSGTSSVSSSMDHLQQIYGGLPQRSPCLMAAAENGFTVTDPTGPDGRSFTVAWGDFISWLAEESTTGRLPARHPAHFLASVARRTLFSSHSCES
jgi:hypothetical protein